MTIEEAWAKLTDIGQESGLIGHTTLLPKGGHDPAECQHCDDILALVFAVLADLQDCYESGMEQPWHWDGYRQRVMRQLK